MDVCSSLIGWAEVALRVSPYFIVARPMFMCPERLDRWCAGGEIMKASVTLGLFAAATTISLCELRIRRESDQRLLAWPG